MQEVAIVTDGVSNLTDDVIEKYNITILPYRITFEDEVFRCWGVDKNEISRDEFFERLSCCNKDNLPRTSIPTPHEIVTAYEEALTKGKFVIAIFLSGDMSSINDNARQFAINLLPDKDISVFDSKQATTGVGILALYAAKLAAENKTKDEILNALELVYKKIRTTFVFQNLEYLYLSGHIGRAKKFMASTFGLNPVLYMGDGIIQGAGVLSKNKVKNQLKKYGEMILEKAEFNEIFFWHTRNPKVAEEIYEHLEASNKNGMKIHYFEANPLVGYHTGANSFAFSYIGDWDKDWILK
ncbi:MAG: DegV family protein [Asgard group archaeon]|nr:DegV family protein [Asgard group archaeon]